MRAVLEERLSSVGAGHVLILPHRWEETEIEPVDVVVAGGCLYVFYDIDQALLKMVASGRHKVIITHLANDGLWDFEKRVCERLLLDSPSLFPPFALLADVFLHLKLAATIDLFYLPESRRLSLEQWAERCQRRLKVPEARRSALLKAIANELHATGDYYVAEQSFPFVLIQIQSE
jgi:hypothetical protein